MKRIIIIIFAIFGVIIFSNAQSYQMNLKATMNKKFGPFLKGNPVVITDVRLEPVYWKNVDEENVIENLYTEELRSSQTDIKDGDALYCLTINNRVIPIIKSMTDRFNFEPQSIQDFWDSQIIHRVLFKLQEKGMQNELRAEMEADALEYINKLKAYGLVLNDPYLELYIYSVVSKLVPERIIDGRPGNVNIVIVQDTSMNACMFPNGTMIITTGLLARIHSEDELAAVLAHEISHFMLDHSVQNINEAKDRQKRTEFWAAIATGIMATTEAYVAANNVYYKPGMATMAVSAISSAIATEVVKRLGMKYKHVQENDADKAALSMLSLAGYNPNALATVFYRMIEMQKVERRSSYYFDSYEHPALVKRLNHCGTPEMNDVDIKFERIVSFAVTNTAKMKFEDRRFKQALELTTQNVENGVATSDDYLIRANCMLALYNTETSNMEVLSMINKAKEVDQRNINIFKIEILANLRLGNKTVAITELNEYVSALENMIEQSRWKEDVDFALPERIWAINMISKLRAL